MCAACIFATGFNIPDDLKKGCCVLYTIQLDENGCTHTNDCYGFSITFPPGSLLSNQTVTLTIGVMIHGPFLFPDNVVPISPILWVCGNCCDLKLLKNATIVLQHCLDIEKSDDRGIQILFMKAHVNQHCIVSGNKRRYIFQSMGNASVLEDHNAESLTSHFCSFCLATKMSDTLKEQTQYCITLFADKANSKCVFAVTYLLKACIQVNSMQKPRVCITFHLLLYTQSLKKQCKDMECLEKYDFKWEGSSILKMQYSNVDGWQLTLLKGLEGVSNDCYWAV